MIPLLTVLALFEVVVHASVVYRVVTDRSEIPGRWGWVAFLSVIGAVFGMVAWSYLGVWVGDRTPTDHFHLITVLGIPILAYPGLLLAAMIVQGDRQAEKVAAEIAAARAHDAELLRRVANVGTVVPPDPQRPFDDLPFDNSLFENDDGTGADDVAEAGTEEGADDA